MEKRNPTYFLKPTQVFYRDWREEEDPAWMTGIAFRNEIICGCCGGIIDIDDIIEAGIREGCKEVIFPYKDWCDISDELTGGECPPGLAIIEGKLEIIEI